MTKAPAKLDYACRKIRPYDIPMPLFDLRDDSVAVFFPDGSSLTFKEFRDRIEQEKEKPKDRTRIFPLAASPDPTFLISFLACLEGAQPVALFNPQWTEKETHARQKQLEAAFDPQLSLILFTSGSSGSPKAVQLSMVNIQANTQAVVGSLDFQLAREQTLFLPLHYSYGILGQLLPALRVGLTSRLHSQFPRLILELSHKSPVGMWSGVPSHWETLLRALGPSADTSQVSHVISAGAPFSISLRERLREKFPQATLYNNYGMTECSPRVLSFNSRHPDFFGDYVGFPVGDFKVKADANEELCLTGSQVMLGYLGDPNATSARIQNGWLRTGDRAQVRSDGLISLEGRLDDLVNIAGERLSLIEIENELKASPEIRDAAVTTRLHPVNGTSLVAIVVPEIPEQWDPQKFMRALHLRISTQKVPKEYVTVDQLPRLASGKIDRTRFVEILKRT